MSAERYEPRDPHGRFRYGPWRGGPDPLAAPYDVRAAIDKIGADVLSAGNVRDSLRELLREGLDGRGGLDRLAEKIRRLRNAARRRGDLGGDARPGPRRARPGPGRRAGGAGRRRGRRRPVRRDGARHAARRRGGCRPRPRLLRLDVARGAPDVRADQADAAARGARRAVRGDEAGPGEPGPRGHGPGQGHARRPQPAARQARPQRGHDRRLPRVHGQARRVLPRAARDHRGAHRRARPPPGRGPADDELAQPRAARAARPADVRRAGRRRPGVGDGPARRQPPVAAARARPRLRRGHASRRRGPRLLRGRRGRRRDRRPRGARGAAVAERLRLHPRRRRRRPAGAAARATRRSATSRRCATWSASSRSRAT